MYYFQFLNFPSFQSLISYLGFVTADITFFPFPNEGNCMRTTSWRAWGGSPWYKVRPLFWRVYDIRCFEKSPCFLITKKWAVYPVACKLAWVGIQINSSYLCCFKFKMKCLMSSQLCIPPANIPIFLAKTVFYILYSD